MNQAVADPLAPQCGNCQFWQHLPNHPAGNAGECLGVPPTPVLVGARPRQFGNGVDMHLENVRPVMVANGRPCSLHRPVQTIDLGASHGRTQ